MSELRKDYIFDSWVIISEKRGKRPSDYKKLQAPETNPKDCVFCAGNESQTPPEILKVLNKNKKWTIRSFENKYSAVVPKNNKKIKTKGILTFGPAYGFAEVIVESNNHNKNLEDYDVPHIVQVLEVYAQRIAYHLQNKDIKYISVFKNHHKEAGASINHSHSQLLAYNHLPSTIKEEIEILKKHKKCPYCNIIKAESKSKRLCAKNKNFVAIAPFASQFNFEVSIYSTKHKGSLLEFNRSELSDLASILKKILLKLKKINAPYNLYMHGSQHHENVHFHLEIKPRLNTFAGFELETGTIINSMPPEKAAQFYKK